MTGAASEVAYLSRALKAPRIPEAARVLAERARDESWDYEAYLAAVLSEEVSSRETHGGQARVKRARFPQIKTLDDFDFTFQRSVSALRSPTSRSSTSSQRQTTSCFWDRPAPLNTARSFHPRYANSPASSRLTWIRSPFRLPFLTYTALSSPRWTLCKTV
jgi:hypothetical protein